MPRDTWINIYTASGIAVGTQIIVQNLGNNDLKLASQELVPNESSAYILCRPYEEKVNDKHDDGAWVWSYTGGLINVRTLKDAI